MVLGLYKQIPLFLGNSEMFKGRKGIMIVMYEVVQKKLHFIYLKATKTNRKTPQHFNFVNFASLYLLAVPSQPFEGVILVSNA